MKRFFLFLVFGLFFNFRAAEGAELHPVPFVENEASFDTSGPLFQKLASQNTGIQFVNPIDFEHPNDRLYYSAMACGSVAAGDLDGDGLVDLFFANGPVSNRLFRQTSHFVFEDETETANVADSTVWSTGAALADVDGDGDLDIYICCYDSPNRLFINESKPGELQFHERAKDFGLDFKDAGLMPSFADFDQDGDLDVFVAVNAYYRKGGRPAGGIPIQKKGQNFQVLAPWDRFFGISGIDPESGEPKYEEIGRPNALFRNDGEAGFVNISESAGILTKPSHTNSAAWFDFDDDGDLDLHVGNDFSDRDEFYRNEGNGTFTEIAGQIFQHTTWFTMGSAAADFNNDGTSDFIVADMLPTSHFREKVTMGEMGASFDSMFAEGLPRQNMKNAFFLNTGTGLFFEMAHQAGIARSDWTWTVKSGDLDGDGWIDIFLPTGHTRDFNNSDLSYVTPAMRVGKNYWDFYESAPELREPNLAFRNIDGFSFEKQNAEWGLSNEASMSYSSALADLDGDGDLDLVIHGLDEEPGIFRNIAAERGDSQFLQLAGLPLGTKAVATLKSGRKFTRQLLPHNGYLESDEPILHFGLSKNDSISNLQIQYPDGTENSFSSVKAGARYEVSQKTKNEPKVSESLTQSPLFRASGSLLSLDFRETPFDDFSRQPLLPHKHSQLGPQQAWGDIDGDGKLDIVIGSPAGKPTRLLLNRGLDDSGNPIFALRNRDPFTSDAAFEDAGVTLFDADSDGDLDIYAVSGGVENRPELLADRLYFNDGKGNFSRSENGWLPNQNTSGSVARAADFDQDGDLDLFVGGRIVPGKYPLPAESAFLKNESNTRFSNEIESVAPALKNSGLVTDAIWSDLDGDGWLDLLVCHEWGPVKFFRNDQAGKLIEATESANLSGLTGWWNCLSVGDFDQDGDIDFAAGNFGLNTKYRPSATKPEILFYGDFDNSGTSRIVEAKISDGKVIPRRGFSCSREAMPFLDQKMKSFTNFAKSTLGEIYDTAVLDSAQKFTATTFESGIFLNNGSAQFSFQPLPRLAQTAPVFGIAAADFDGDQILDLVLAQNFHSPQQETGPMDGGLSLFLKGLPASGNDPSLFKSVWPKESGILVPGDAKSAGVGDLNGDGKLDVLIGVNNGPQRLFLNQGK